MFKLEEQQNRNSLPQTFSCFYLFTHTFRYNECLLRRNQCPPIYSPILGGTRIFLDSAAGTVTTVECGTGFFSGSHCLLDHSACLGVCTCCDPFPECTPTGFPVVAPPHDLPPYGLGLGLFCKPWGLMVVIAFLRRWLFTDGQP